jgi:hypothetical protein
MTDRPIIFSAPMVRALLAGAKTQTRRVLTSARVFATPERQAWTLSGADLDRALQNADRFRRIDGDGWFWESDAFEWQAPHTRTGWMARIGYAPGDRLWVRESVQAVIDADEFDAVKYLADSTVATSEADTQAEADRFAEQLFHYRRRKGAPDSTSGVPVPSIHMPRWVSRLTLIVSDVRIERLQDISRDDAIAEGATSRPNCSGFRQMGTGWSMDWSEVGKFSRHATGGPGPLREQDISLGDPRAAFGAFINLLHGGERWNCNGTVPLWDQNPFVVAVTFQVAKANIDKAAPAPETAYPTPALAPHHSSPSAQDGTK